MEAELCSSQWRGLWHCAIWLDKARHSDNERRTFWHSPARKSFPVDELSVYSAFSLVP